MTLHGVLKGTHHRRMPFNSRDEGIHRVRCQSLSGIARQVTGCRLTRGAQGESLVPPYTRGNTSHSLPVPSGNEGSERV